MPNLYTQYRIHSQTRPSIGVGMKVVFATAGNPGFTREHLEAVDAETLSFYMDSYLMVRRGEERYGEEFVLQATTVERPSESNWDTIKRLTPLPGEDPHEFDDDFGNCADCDRPLEESEFALGHLCRDCLDKKFEDWEPLDGR